MENKKNEIDILDILIVLAKRKWFIIITTFIVSVFAVTYALLTDEYWTSSASIRPVSQRSSSFSLSASSLLGGLGSSLIGGTQSESVDLITIMKSREFSDAVVNKFNLIEYFELDFPDPILRHEMARTRLLEELIGIGLNDENGVVTISATTTNKNLSAEIANYYWMKLDEYIKTTQMTKGKQNRIFIEERLETVSNEIKRLSEKMKQFQEDNNVIDLNGQVASVVSIYSELMSKKLENEIKREYSIKFLDVKSFEIEDLDKKISILENRLKELTKNQDKDTYVISIDNIPSLVHTYAELKTELAIQKKVYEFLYPQYESAKIEELKDLPTIEIIDRAVLAGMRSKPRRARLCIIAFIMAIISSSILIILTHALQSKTTKLKILTNEIFSK